MSTEVKPPTLESHQPNQTDEQSNSEQLPRDEFEALKSQLDGLFEQFDTKKSGRIAARDLFSMIELFEQNQQNGLLNDESRPLLQSFCESNAEVELSVDEVLQLVKKLRPSAATPVASASTSSNDPALLAGRPRKTPITKFGSLRSNWRKRQSPVHSSLRDTEPNQSESDIAGDGDFSSPHMGNQPMLSSTGMSPMQNHLMRPSKYNHPGNNFGAQASTNNYYDVNGDESETSFEGSGAIDEVVSQMIPMNDDPAVQLSRLYRHTVELTKKLKESERHLASVARQHEDRIEELQHKLEETKVDLALKKREIQDHKSKEKTNLHQISALESEISKVAKNLNGQKQLYHTLKKLYEEQYGEAQKLRDLVLVREEALSSSEKNLSTFLMEERKWQEEREQLEQALTKLEADVATAQASEIELEEQRNENMHLKATIDKLKVDLAEIRDSSGRNVNDFEATEGGTLFEVTEGGTLKNLHAELTDLAIHSMEEEAGSDYNTDDAGARGDRKPGKMQRRRKDDNAHVEPINDDATQTRNNEIEKYRPPEQEHAGRKNRSTRRQVAEGNGAARGNSNTIDQYQTLSSELGVQYAIIENLLRSQQIPNSIEKRDSRSIRSSHDAENTELNRSTRSSRKTPRPRKRGVTPIPDNEGNPSSDTQVAPMTRSLVTRNPATMAVAQQNAVNSTVTFALYTLVVYLFGIITSVFVLDNNQGSLGYADWSGFDSIGEDSVMARSVQIILYWMETLLNDGNNMVPT